MGIKKKKSSKKIKSSKGTGADPHDDIPVNNDPNTLIAVPDGSPLAPGNATSPTSGVKGKGKKKGKKGKRLKLNRNEKAQEKMEKAVLSLKENKDYYNSFLNRMDRWLVQITPIAISLFKRLDSDGEGVVSYDDFKSGMFDLNVPLNQIEVHLLATLLDQDNCGEINYMEFSKGLQYVKELDDVKLEGLDQEDKLILTTRNLEKCPCSKIMVDGPYREASPKFILLMLRLATFDGMKNHPGHLQVLVHTHIPVFGIIQIIVEQTSVQSTKLAVFSDKSRSTESRLSAEQTLQEYGFRGGSRQYPEEATLFYDYTVEFKDCPLLLCDHYFGNHVKNV